ncbi:MAG: hypothetical protein JXJ22_18315 [Bacteroidales bacterium]|nr:hypothetical protein [Bacteroidales bacterium]
MHNFKKHSAYIFLWIATFILLIHILIPHHHHIEFQEHHYVSELICESEITCGNPEQINPFESHNCQHKHQECLDCFLKTDVTFTQSQISIDCPVCSDNLYPNHFLTGKPVSRVFYFNPDYSNPGVSSLSSRAPPKIS